MDRPWWAHVIQWIVWGILMTIVMGWLARSRHRPRPESDAMRLVHPRSTLIIALVGFGFFLGIAILSNVYANPTTTPVTTSVFLGFALLSFMMIAEYFLARHEITEEGLYFGRLFGRRGYLLWSQVKSVRYAPVMKWFRIETDSGEVARISAMLMGLPQFARTVLTRVPETAVDENTRQALEDIATGHLPEIWASGE